MDLLVKTAIVAVILVIVVGLAIALAYHPQKTQLTQGAAEQTVLSDISAQNPNASVQVVNISQSRLENDSWQIVLSITYNATRPCPTLFIEGFDYPATGLNPTVDNLYTSNCRIYGISAAPSYVISSPEIAIVQSYEAANASAKGYVSEWGYDNTNVNATFRTSLNGSATPLGRPFANIWLVRYNASNAGYDYYVVLSQSGSTLGNYTFKK
jgi:hypothetical protein